MNKLLEVYNVDFQEATKMKTVVGQSSGNILQQVATCEPNMEEQ